MHRFSVRAEKSLNHLTPATFYLSLCLLMLLLPLHLSTASLVVAAIAFLVRVA